MKKLFLLAAALMALAACKKDDPEPAPVQPDAISVSPDSRTVGGDGGSVTVTVTSSGDWTLAASGGATYNWVSADKTSGSNGDRVIFKVEKNTDAEKTASFVFTCGTAKADFSITSTPEEVVIPTIEVTSSATVEADYASGTFQVTPKVSNVEVSSLTASSSADWVKYQNAASGSSEGTAVMNFSYTANDSQEPREATVTISYPNADPATVTVSQKGKPEEGGGDEPAGASVAYMKDHCASPELVLTAENDIQQINWNKPDVLKFGKTVTVEMLVKHDAEFEEKKGGGQWDGTWVNTIFGIEGRFLIRQGDNTENYRQWELVYCETGGKEHKFRSEADLPGGEWAHIAVVVDGSAETVTLYQNGKNVGSGSFPATSMYDIDLTVTFSGWAQDQAFALGRSYDNCRDFCGAMSEVRVWNRALSGDEINASGHFYSVDPASSGLVAYWKMDDGQGNTIKDYTSNGNDLKGYRIINTSTAAGKQGLGNWELGMTWQEEEPAVTGFPR